MFKKKFVRQENIKDCGAACLLMVMRHYGGNSSMERLREMMKTDRNGTTALNFIMAAKNVGFDARGYKYNSCNDLLPYDVVHVVIDKIYNHFMVIDKIDKKRQIIITADPAFGYRKYTFDEFNQIWTNVVITLHPIRKIDNIKSLTKIKKTIKQIVKPYRKFFIMVLILSILYTIFNIISTFYFKIVVEDANLQLNSKLPIFIFFIIVLITKTIIDYIRSRILIFINNNLDKEIMVSAFKHLLSLPIQYFNSRQTGDIVSRLNDLSYVKELISMGATILLMDFVLVIGSIFIMYIINVQLFLIAVVILVLYGIVVIFYNQTIKYYAIRKQEEEATVASNLIETIKGINSIKNLCIEKETYDKVMDKYCKYVDNNYKFNKKYIFIQMIKDYILNAGFLFIIFLGSVFIANGTLSVSELVLFVFFLNFFLDPLKNIFDIEPLLRASLSALIRISEFFDIEENAKTKEKLEINNIKIHDLSYSYNGLDNVIKDINLQINKSEKIMINGASGCGKSTIAKILMRHLDIEGKGLYINQEDISKYPINLIRNSICYVSQDEILFKDSLYNNIKLNRELIETEIDDVIKLTCSDEILRRHNLDIHMLLEEDGSNLSGGERQRLIIARALLKDSNVFIFDESMSEMSTALERKILQNIFTNYNDKTIIVISHRLDNADLYDKVIMLDNLKKVREERVVL